MLKDFKVISCSTAKDLENEINKFKESISEIYDIQYSSSIAATEVSYQSVVQLHSVLITYRAK